MQISLVPAVSVGDDIDRNQLFHVEAARGTGLFQTLTATTSRGHVQLSGAQLRAGILSAVHPGPWELAPVGAGRRALRLDPDGVASSITHLDDGGIPAPEYWLYQRTEASSVHLTRWRPVGHLSRARLLGKSEIQPTSETKTARQRALTELVATGLPDTIELDRPRADSTRIVHAPASGWLDIHLGALTTSPGRLPVHRVDDLGPWPLDPEVSN